MFQKYKTTYSIWIVYTLTLRLNIKFIVNRLSLNDHGKSLTKKYIPSFGVRNTFGIDIHFHSPFMGSDWKIQIKRHKFEKKAWEC